MDFCEFPSILDTVVDEMKDAADEAEVEERDLDAVDFDVMLSEDHAAGFEASSRRFALD